jgi:hypothetical protein
MDSDKHWQIYDHENRHRDRLPAHCYVHRDQAIGLREGTMIHNSFAAAIRAGRAHRIVAWHKARNYTPRILKTVF